MALKKIIIADEASSEVLDILFTDEEVSNIRDALMGDSPFGISVFDTKEDYEEASSEEDDE
jgi:hypothetical protein